MGAIALFPLALVLVLIGSGRCSTAASAGVGLGVSLVVAALCPGFELGIDQLAAAGTRTAVLFASAAVVIAAGLHFGNVAKAGGFTSELADAVDGMSMGREARVLTLILGLLPALESLTGFGVSLVVGVPLFVRLAGRERGVLLAMLSMNIMPWGTLGLATSLGGELAGIDSAALGARTAVTSFLVYPVVGIASLFVLGGLESVRRAGAQAVCLGVIQSFSLLLASRHLSFEIAGILSGLVVTVVGFAGAALRSSLPRFDARQIPTLVPVFGTIVAWVIFVSLYEPAHALVTSVGAVEAAGLKFAILASPAIPLGAAALALNAMSPNRASLVRSLLDARRAMTALALFIAMSQVMLLSGMIERFAEIVVSVGEGSGAMLSSVGLGCLSGLVTGSNVGGNALMMAAQTEMGNALGSSLTFAAIQNSAAGHSVFASVPIVVLIRTLANGLDGAGEGHANEEGAMLRFGLLILPFVAASVAVMAFVSS